MGNQKAAARSDFLAYVRGGDHPIAVTAGSNLHRQQPEADLTARRRARKETTHSGRYKLRAYGVVYCLSSFDMDQGFNAPTCGMSIWDVSSCGDRLGGILLSTQAPNHKSNNRVWTTKEQGEGT